MKKLSWLLALLLLLPGCTILQPAAEEAMLSVPYLDPERLDFPHMVLDDNGYYVNGCIPFALVQSEEELSAFVETYGERFSSKDVNSMPKSFDRDFFEKNGLILAYICSSSGGNRYAFDGFEIDSGNLVIKIKEDGRGVTCDMAGWLAVIRVSKNQLEETQGIEVVRTK